MRMLFISHEPWYGDIVNELRKFNEVDYIYLGSTYKTAKGDFQISGLIGSRKVFCFCAFLVANYLLMRNRYDICLTDYKSLYFPAVFLFIRKYIKGCKTKYIYDIRTIPVDHEDSRISFYEKDFLKKLSFADRYFDGITVITWEMKSYIQRKYMSFKKPVGIWESGVNTANFIVMDKDLSLRRSLGFQDDDFVCFYHGSLGLKRGVGELVEAFTILVREYSGIKLFILGSGKCHDKLLEIIERNNLDANVKLKGWVVGEMVPRFISIADLCIIPLPDIDWWRVSSPLKLMEYIACGKNILLSRMAAHLNVVGGDCGYFWVDRITADSLAEGIEDSYRRYMADPVRFRENGLLERERLVNEISYGCRARSLLGFITTVVGEV